MTVQHKATQLALLDYTVERSRESMFSSVRAAVGSLELKQHVVLITMDVCRFSDINMTFGFDCGDAALRIISERLLQVLRPEDLLFRTGDDEFSLLLNPVLHRDHALLAVNKIQKLFDNPIMIDGVEHAIEIRIGLSVYPDTAIEPDELIRQSVFALGMAKREDAEYLVYEPTTEGNNQQQMISRQIKEALYAGHITLLYQPIFDPNQDRITGMEALSRWVRGKEDVVMPIEFIPVVERTGLMGRFTQWVLNTALRECADFEDCFITVNISATNLEDVAFADQVQRALSTWRVAPNRLILEVTETTLMRDLDSTRYVLDSLSKVGVMLAIDDFGSGYSSLKYIRELPVSYLKIEGAFIKNLTSDSGEKMIVDAVCKLGHSFGLKVIAEHVSNEDCMKIATELGCDLLQGFHIARPLEPAQLQHILNTESH